jgi:integrase
VRTHAHDLKLFFTVVGKVPVEVTPADVMAFIESQSKARPGAENVVRIADGGAGLTAATMKRRLASVSALYGYLLTHGDAGVTANPVPGGLPTRRSRLRGGRGIPLIKVVRRLPRILDPIEVDELMGALRRDRDRTMVRAMVGAVGVAARCSAFAWSICAWVSGVREASEAFYSSSPRHLLPRADRQSCCCFDRDVRRDARATVA